jgi:hypothetical protein
MAVEYIPVAAGISAVECIFADVRRRLRRRDARHHTGNDQLQSGRNKFYIGNFNGMAFQSGYDAGCGKLSAAHGCIQTGFAADDISG